MTRGATARYPLPSRRSTFWSRGIGLKTSLYFNRSPLLRVEMRSRELANKTWRLAAEAGFGYYGGYLGADLAVQGLANDTAEFGGSDDVPLVLPAPPDGHDRGIARDPEAFARVFSYLYPGHVFTGLDEYVGYTHADIRAETGPRANAEKAGSPQIAFNVSFDPHYCRALIAKGSSWHLHVSDWLRGQLRPGKLRVQ